MPIPLKARGENLLAMASHELRNPLATIMGSLEVLGKGIDCPRERRTFLRVVERAARRLSRTVESLIGVAEGEARRRRPETVDLRAVVSEVLSAHRARARVAGVRLLRPRLPALLAKADPADLPHVFENLVGNAVKYNRRGGEVRVTGRRHGRWVEVAVSDTGIGIPRACLGRVFDRFYRSPRALGERGSGLGLSVVRTLVKANGGRVTAESVEGRGSIFRVRLRAAR